MSTAAAEPPEEPPGLLSGDWRGLLLEAGEGAYLDFSLIFR